MAQIERKRRRKDTQFEPKKKLRSEPYGGGNPATARAAVTLETLPWHEVPVPEHFEDAEGFFGLEEISDVDVVKDSGRVEYKVRQRDNGSSSQVNTVEPANEDTEWEGFGDNAETEHCISNSVKVPSSKAKKPSSKTIKSQGKEGKQEPLGQNRSRTSGNTFDVLGGGDDGAEDSDGGDLSAWDFLHLSSDIVSSLARLKFYRPSPIQTSALPHILEGHDAICKAPTGSGKTLAFGIPIYECCIKSRTSGELFKSKVTTGAKYNPIALIISPTRELAHQLADHLQQLGSVSESSPRIATLTGGLSMHKQQRLLPNADIVIGTPGRLKEVMDGLPDLAKALREIKFLVLDEADRLLSSGRYQELEEILVALDRTKATDEGTSSEPDERLAEGKRQTLVFSATFEKDLQQKLAGKSKFSGIEPGGQASMEYLLRKLHFREQKPKFIDINPGSSF